MSRAEEKLRVGNGAGSDGAAARRESVLDRFRLDGRVALVTGGGQGLGQAMAIALAEAGADVAVVARRDERLAATCDAVRAIGRRAVSIPLDLALDDAPGRAVERCVAELGRLDILVAAAGTQLRKPALEVAPAEWDAVVAVNLRAVYFSCQAAARQMLAQERLDDGARGKIITIASLTAVQAWPDVSVYGMTKGGVVQMTKALALEWGRHGITVNAIGPGTFPTELTEPLYSDPDRVAAITARLPAGRPGAVRDVEGATVLLASPASDYITGEVLWVDGGWLVT